jgi:hypothetical protein
MMAYWRMHAMGQSEGVGNNGSIAAQRKGQQADRQRGGRGGRWEVEVHAALVWESLFGCGYRVGSL